MRKFHARRLPHIHALGRPRFLTWRLYGSLPKVRAYPSTADSGPAFLAMDRLLDDAETGPLYLRDAGIARMVVDAMHFQERTLAQFELHHYVVMANHVHLLITSRMELSKVTHTLKRFTAREANRLLGLVGHPFWQDESYDRIVRDGEEFQRIARYIENNPVKAGVVASPEEFSWSSAGRVRNPPQVANLRHIY